VRQSIRFHGNRIADTFHTSLLKFFDMQPFALQRFVHLSGLLNKASTAPASATAIHQLLPWLHRSSICMRNIYSKCKTHVDFDAPSVPPNQRRAMPDHIRHITHVITHIIAAKTTAAQPANFATCAAPPFGVFPVAFCPKYHAPMSVS